MTEINYKYLKYKNKYLKLKGGLNYTKNFGNSLVDTITSTTEYLNPTSEKSLGDKIYDTTTNLTKLGTLSLIKYNPRDLCSIYKKENECQVFKRCEYKNGKCYLKADELCKKKIDNKVKELKKKIETAKENYEKDIYKYQLQYTAFKDSCKGSEVVAGDIYDCKLINMLMFENK